MTSVLRVVLVGALAAAGGCDFRGMSRAASEEPPVTLYGVGDAPDEAPASCKFVIKVEVTSLDKNVPEQKLRTEARKNEANAVTSIRIAGNTDGYLGKEYNFRATLLRCPRAPRPTTSASGAASLSASASPLSQ